MRVRADIRRPSEVRYAIAIGPRIHKPSQRETGVMFSYGAVSLAIGVLGYQAFAIPPPGGVLPSATAIAEISGFMK